MNDSPKWSTNEIENRYSGKELKSVEYFLSFDDPRSEMRHKSNIELPTGHGTHYLIHDPIETLFQFSAYAEKVLINIHTPSRPFIAEDELFLQLEYRQEQNSITADGHLVTAFKHSSVGWLALLATIVGGRFLSVWIFAIGLLFGCMAAIGYTWGWIRAHFDGKKRKKGAEAILFALGRYEKKKPKYVLEESHDIPDEASPTDKGYKGLSR